MAEIVIIFQEKKQGQSIRVHGGVAWTSVNNTSWFRSCFRLFLISADDKQTTLSSDSGSVPPRLTGIPGHHPHLEVHGARNATEEQLRFTSGKNPKHFRSIVFTEKYVSLYWYMFLISNKRNVLMQKYIISKKASHPTTNDWILSKIHLLLLLITTTIKMIHPYWRQRARLHINTARSPRRKWFQ